MGPMRILVRVFFTDRTRTSDGHYLTRSSLVVVLDDEPGGPILAAEQMVAARIDAYDGMVLGSTCLGEGN